MQVVRGVEAYTPGKEGLCPCRVGGNQMAACGFHRRTHDLTGCAGSSQNLHIGADVVLLAVKPKQFAEVSAGLNGHLQAGAVAISLMTAIDLDGMARGLGIDRVVRASTNIGIQAGVATTYWAGSSALGTGNRTELAAIFDAWGDSFECESEKLLDVAMVGVGSKPALVIEFARAMIAGIKTNGMPAELAEKGILSLVSGTAVLVNQGGRSPEAFQKSVVTPGGITAEALASLGDDGFSESIVRAFQKALDRTSQLTSPDKN